MGSFGNNAKSEIEDALNSIFEDDYDSQGLFSAKNNNPKAVVAFAADVAEVMQWLLQMD